MASGVERAAPGAVPWSAKLALIFGTSALVLTLQLLQSRILAAQFWHHLVYFVITLGFLGFAASGTYLSVVASVVAIPVAMTWGFSAVLVVAGACYIAAWAILGLWSSKAEPSIVPPVT